METLFVVTDTGETAEFEAASLAAARAAVDQWALTNHDPDPEALL